MTDISTNASGLYIEKESGFYEFEATPGVAHLVVTVGSAQTPMERIIAVFKCVADVGVPVFLAKLHGHEVSFAVEGRHLPTVEGALTNAGYSFRSRHDLAVLTVRTETLEDLTGLMVRIADALQLAGARMYGLGDSHSSVQCLVDGHRVEAALKQLQVLFSRGAVHA